MSFRFVEAAEVMEAFQSLGRPPVSLETVRAKIKKFDANGDGVLNFQVREKERKRDKVFTFLQEFCAMLDSETKLTEAEMREAFDAFDRDGNGKLSRDEIVRIVKVGAMFHECSI